MKSYQERKALRRTSRGSEPGGGGVPFTDTPLPPPPPGSNPGPSWADHGTAKEFCDTGSCGPTDTAAPERGAIPCGGPLGSDKFWIGAAVTSPTCVPQVTRGMSPPSAVTGTSPSPGPCIWNLGTPDIIYDIKVPLISYYDIIVLTYDIIVLTYDIMRMIS